MIRQKLYEYVKSMYRRNQIQNAEKICKGWMACPSGVDFEGYGCAIRGHLH